MQCIKYDVLFYEKISQPLRTLEFEGTKKWVVCMYFYVVVIMHLFKAQEYCYLDLQIQKKITQILETLL